MAFTDKMRNMQAEFKRLQPQDPALPEVPELPEVTEAPELPESPVAAGMDAWNQRLGGMHDPGWDIEDGTDGENVDPSTRSPNTGITGGGINPSPYMQQPNLPQQQNVGHDGTSAGGMNRDQYRDAWMAQGAGIKDINALRQWVTQNGGTVLSDNGTVRTPFGEDIDMGTGMRSGGKGSAGWTPVAGGMGTDANLGRGGAGGAAAAGGAGGGFGAGAGGGAVSDAIARLLARGENPVDANDPNIANATAARRAQGDAQRRRARVGLAERASASGLNEGGSGSGFLDAGIQSQYEEQGRDLGEFASGQVLEEVQARRADVVNALQFAQGEERMQLERQLAELNAQIQRESMEVSRRGQDIGNNQFYDQFTYGMSNDAANRDLQYMLSLLQ